MIEFIKVNVKEQRNRRRGEEKIFSSPRITLISISSIRQVQQIDDNLFSILTELVDYRVVGDMQALPLEIKE